MGRQRQAKGRCPIVSRLLRSLSWRGSIFAMVLSGLLRPVPLRSLGSLHCCSSAPWPSESVERLAHSIPHLGTRTRTSFWSMTLEGSSCSNERTTASSSGAYEFTLPLFHV